MGHLWEHKQRMHLQKHFSASLKPFQQEAQEGKQEPKEKVQA